MEDSERDLKATVPNVARTTVPETSEPKPGTSEADFKAFIAREGKGREKTKDVIVDYTNPIYTRTNEAGHGQSGVKSRAQDQLSKNLMAEGSEN